MQANSTPPKLLDQVRDRIRVKHYSIRTETQYVQWIKRFILFHGKRHPQEMGAAEVEVFCAGSQAPAWEPDAGSSSFPIHATGSGALRQAQDRLPRPHSQAGAWERADLIVGLDEKLGE